jgi:hypothetical protein
MSGPRRQMTTAEVIREEGSVAHFGVHVFDRLFSPLAPGKLLSAVAQTRRAILVRNPLEIRRMSAKIGLE